MRHLLLHLHLDTYFNIIDKDLCTLVESRYHAKEGDPEWVTVDLYTRKSGEKEYTLTEQNLPFVEFLQQQGFTIIPIKLEDESKELQDTLAQHGVNVEWIPLETLIKGYGAAHCMTQVIRVELAK